MKKQFLLLALLAGLFMASCSKNNTNTPTTTVATKFTFRGKAYTSKGLYSYSSTTLDDIIDSAVADDNSTKVIINFLFKKGTAAVGTYAIVGGTDTTPSDNQVALLVFETDLKNTQNVGLYTSRAGGSLVISGSGNAVSLKAPAITVAGDYYNNNDPKNTQITEVSTSISAATFTKK